MSVIEDEEANDDAELLQPGRIVEYADRGRWSPE